MTRKTEGVQILVQDVLKATFLGPYGRDIILRVFKTIEEDNNREWQRRYDELSEELSHDVVNNWIGKYTKDETRLRSLRTASAKGKSKLITAYTELG